MTRVHICPIHNKRWNIDTIRNKRCSKRITRNDYKLIKKWYDIPHSTKEEFFMNFDNFYEHLGEIDEIQNILERVFLDDNKQNIALLYTMLYELIGKSREPTEREWAMMQDKIFKKIEEMFLPIITQDTTKKFISCQNKFFKRKSKVKEIKLQIEKLNSDQPDQKNNYCSLIKKIMNSLKIGKKYESKKLLDIESIVTKCRSKDIIYLIGYRYLRLRYPNQREIIEQKRWVEGKGPSWIKNYFKNRKQKKNFKKLY